MSTDGITMARPPAPLAHPTLYRASKNVSIPVDYADNVEQVYLMERRSSSLNDDPPRRAYARWNKSCIELGDKGKILFCQLLKWDPTSNVFRRSPTTVAIKKLKRSANVSNDNPYNEITIMKQYGNDKHMIDCIEALWDDKSLYIIMLYFPESDLHSCRIQPDGISVAPLRPYHAVSSVTKKLVHNLQYMKQHALVHRDLKPQNILVNTTEDWFTFIDFAMTLQAQIDERSGLAHDITPQGSPGTRCYISPEVFREQSFNYKADIWALGCTLWNFLTGIHLYSLPYQGDRCYDFFILEGGLADEFRCHEKLEELLQTRHPHVLIPRLQAIRLLSPEARDLLSQLLQHDAANRPSLDDILNHEFFQDEHVAASILSSMED